jgi:hypothetical protein
VPADRSQRPGLAERHIVTEDIGVRGDPAIAQEIRARSQRLGRPRLEVEAEITRRTMGHLADDDVISSSEELGD